MKRTLLAAALLTLSGTALAQPFYLDIGTAYGTVDATNCATCTSDKDESTILYDSSTTVIDLDNNGIDAGDTVITDGGLGVALLPGNTNPHPSSPFGGLAANQITGFNPSEVFGSFADNDYGTSWVMSFAFTGLTGTVTGIGAGGIPLLAYGPGLLEFFVTTDGTTFNNFMDLNITSGGSTATGTALFGNVDFTAVDAGFNDLFHSASYQCDTGGGVMSDSFVDIWTYCGAGALEPLEISLDAHFDTNVLIADFVADAGNDGAGGDDLYYVSSNHDGSFIPTIPEPGTMALFGASLLMLGGIARRKKA